MDNKNDKINEIIKHCIEDMRDLEIIMETETSNDMIQVWKYQHNLNKEIIKNLLAENYTVASALMRELSRSIIAATNYSILYKERKTRRMEL
jgi:hypothetical protein